MANLTTGKTQKKCGYLPEQVLSLAFWFVAGRKLLGAQRLSKTTTLIKEIGIVGQNPLVEINQFLLLT